MEIPLKVRNQRTCLEFHQLERIFNGLFVEIFTAVYIPVHMIIHVRCNVLMFAGRSMYFCVGNECMFVI